MSYDSDSEDKLRKVLDIDGQFAVMDDTSGYTFKLQEFKPQVMGQDGKWVPFEGVMAIRPVKPASVVSRIKQAMGDGEHGIWTGTTFVPPAGFEDAATEDVFAPRWVNSSTPVNRERFCIRRRFVPHVSGLKTMAIYTDGACSSNGSTTDTPHGGWAFIFKGGLDGTVSGSLENEGPDEKSYVHTSNRAELRAVLGALGYRAWHGEGFERLVIITDSEYVGHHATGFTRQWAARGWKTSSGRPVANQDLWKSLSEKLGAYAKGGCEVSFWVVKRRWNVSADRAAKSAVEKRVAKIRYQEVVRVGI